jgi:intracellular sulfur oxidation DsrE/DsrF family protein
MNRRGIFGVAIATISAPFAVAKATAAPAASDVPKVAYHLCDLDKVNFVLGNIENHFAGMGGPDKVTIALVVHGPALKAFHAASAKPDIKQRLGKFTNSGLVPHACGNTLKAQNITVNELLPGFTVAERGGVVLLAELQARGFAYLKP